MGNWNNSLLLTPRINLKNDLLQRSSQPKLGYLWASFLLLFNTHSKIFIISSLYKKYNKTCVDKTMVVPLTSSVIIERKKKLIKNWVGFINQFCSRRDPRWLTTISSGWHLQICETNCIQCSSWIYDLIDRSPGPIGHNTWSFGNPEKIMIGFC